MRDVFGQLWPGREQLYTSMANVQTKLHVDLGIAPSACTSVAMHHVKPLSTCFKRSAIEHMPHDKLSSSAIS